MIRLALSIARLTLAVLCFLFALLAVFEAPIDFLWKPAIVATEAGHLGVPLVFGLAAFGWRGGRLSRASFAAALGALLLLVSPVVRATVVAGTLPERLAGAFPGPITGRPYPLVYTDLVGLSLDERKVVPRVISYHQVDGRPLLLDLYRTDGDENRPLIVFIHGGSWQGGERTALPDLLHYLAHRGYAVASVEYRLAPAHPFPAAPDDVRAAIAFLRLNADELGVDRRRIVLMGRSAGGHLALLTAYSANDDRIRGVVALYPATDLFWSWEHPANPLVYDSRGTLRAFLGGSPSERKEAYEDASPIRHVSDDSPPTLLLHGGRDELVSVRQSRRLAARLAEAGVPHLLVELPWATHAFEANLAGPGGQLAVFSIERFLSSVFAR